MARGNWSKYHPKPRCFRCGIAIQTKKEIRRTNWNIYCPACYQKLTEILESGKVEAEAADELPNNN